jgi:hypothetical protein
MFYLIIILCIKGLIFFIAVAAKEEAVKAYHYLYTIIKIYAQFDEVKL